MSEAAQHLYAQTSSQLHGDIGEAFKRQRNDVLGHIEATINSDGPNVISQQLNDLISFGQMWPGKHNVYLGDVFNMTDEMRRNNITPGTAQWRSQIQYACDRNLLRLCGTDGDGDGHARVRDESASPNISLATENLNKALHIQQKRYKQGEREGNERKMNSAQNIAERIQEQIKAQDGTERDDFATPTEGKTENPEAAERDRQEQARFDELQAEARSFEGDYSEHFEDSNETLE